MVDVQKAEISPAESILASVYAGCSPVRVVLSHDSEIAWVTARGTFTAGEFPRQWALSPDDEYPYLTEFNSNILAIFPVPALTKEVSTNVA